MTSRTKRKSAATAATQRKANAPQPSSPVDPTPEDQEAASPVSTIRILKKATCPKLSPRGNGELTYHLGYRDEDGQVFLRVTANASSGYFSQEWIALKDIDALMAAENGHGFKAILFKPLYHQKGANNHGFLGAALKAEGIVEVEEEQPLVLYVAEDRTAFDQQVAPLVEEGTALHDEVAEENARKEARKQERLAEQQRRREARMAQEKAAADAKSAASLPATDDATDQEAPKSPDSDAENPDGTAAEG
ncbi:hypothetical protein [Halomonas saccharevitans]|uniref:Uncharacterized protein n=1 Tax=Halomonas saccharevitans TaxID=416872 RepID=A0A1I7CIT9_9GAMM|nr:hypothetical protein [Halomonas saccharevitans]SFT99327.1 hypothetical protein SAMN04487956_14615 [Halomonas saccharevitans]